MWLSDAIRSASSRAMPTWRERVSLGVIAVAILLFVSWYWRFGVLWKLDPQRDAQLANGWVTNCSGPQFSKFAPGGTGDLGPSRPVFKVTEQLVLAVPKTNWPSANAIESEPRECHTISNLPRVHYLYFVIQGNWSGNYSATDIPLQGNKKRFLPDAVTVRVEREAHRPPLTDEEQRQFEQINKKIRGRFTSEQEIGGLTCGSVSPMKPASEQGGLTCWGHRSPSERDEIHFRTFAYENMTPFVWINANYVSSHFGGIRVYWQVWTLDVARAREIDQAIWKTLIDWNLVSESAHQPGR